MMYKYNVSKVISKLKSECIRLGTSTDLFF